MPRVVKDTVSFRPSKSARAILDAIVSISDQSLSDIVNRAIEAQGLAMLEQAEAKALETAKLTKRLKTLKG